MHKRYLGDGVYAEFDGLQINLTTQTTRGAHQIVLDPHVFGALLRFAGTISPKDFCSTLRLILAEIQEKESR